MRSTALGIVAILLAGCSGSTKPPDPAAAPAPLPNADVGRDRAERDAALASPQRMETQKRTEDAAAAADQPR